jgi:hypothetical protein
MKETEETHINQQNTKQGILYNLDNNNNSISTIMSTIVRWDEIYVFSYGM